jgi:undecaprenyl-phosphate 4-deoxy-4-formamido-L-arabinose transferase
MPEVAAEGRSLSKIRSVDVVVPVYNEVANLSALIDEVKARLNPLELRWRLILVDDGSRDNSWQLISTIAANEPNTVGLHLGRNYGQHAAILAGFSRCEADAVVTLDADLQNPPAEIPRLLAKLDEGYDVAGGWRTQRRDSLFRRVASQWMNRLVSLATGVELRDYGCMLRAYRIEVVRLMRDSGEISSFIPALANCFTDRIIEIPVEHAERRKGRSRYSTRKLIQLLLDLVTGFSMLPLRVLSLFGFFLALVGLAFGMLLLGTRLLFGSEWAAGGVFTVFAVLFFFVGAQFLAFGLLGEYIGRIYNEVRRRPQYVIRDSTDGRSGV